MTELNPDAVLQVFTEKSRQEYGVQCSIINNNSIF